LTAEGAHGFHRKGREILEGLAALLKVAPDAILARVQKVLEENRDLKTRKKGLPAAGEAAGPEAVLRERVGSILFLTSTTPGADGKALREAYDRFKKEADELIVALFGSSMGRCRSSWRFLPPWSRRAGMRERSSRRSRPAVRTRRRPPGDGASGGRRACSSGRGGRPGNAFRDPEEGLEPVASCSDPRREAICLDNQRNRFYNCPFPARTLVVFSMDQEDSCSTQETDFKIT